MPQSGHVPPPGAARPGASGTSACRGDRCRARSRRTSPDGSRSRATSSVIETGLSASAATAARDRRPRTRRDRTPRTTGNPPRHGRLGQGSPAPRQGRGRSAIGRPRDRPRRLSGAALTPRDCPRSRDRTARTPGQPARRRRRPCTMARVPLSAPKLHRAPRQDRQPCSAGDET